MRSLTTSAEGGAPCEVRERWVARPNKCIGAVGTFSTGATARRMLPTVFPSKPESHARLIDADEIPPWSHNYLLDFLLYRLKAPAAVLPIAVALSYWGVPFLLSLFDGTTISAATARQIATTFAGLPSPEFVKSLASEFARHQKLSGSNALPYLNDTTHLAFTLVISIGALSAILTMKNFNLTVLRLLREDTPAWNVRFTGYVYRHFRDKAFRKRYIPVCAALGVLSSILFSYLCLSPNYGYWWGSGKNGIAGHVFVAIVGIMVFSGLWIALLLVFGSLMLARLLKAPLPLRPFHRDGCNGLSPLGAQIFLLWCSALCGGMAIVVAVYFGYLDIQKNPLVWLLAVIGTMCIPVLAVIPLYAALRAIRRTQDVSLEHLGSILNHNLSVADLAVQNKDFATADKAVHDLNELKGIFDIIRSVNVWPFNPKALTFIVVINGIQIALTMKQVASLMFSSATGHP
jgi:hypothetical protein